MLAGIIITAVPQKENDGIFYYFIQSKLTPWTRTDFLHYHNIQIRGIKKGSDRLTKPVYYLWKSDFQNKAALSQEKEKYTELGFRVVIYQDGQKGNDIHDGLKALIKNHYINNPN